MDSYKKSRRKSIIAWVIAFVLAIGAAIVSFTPFIFMVLNSFKEKFEMLTKGVFQLPDKLNWSNYTEVLTGGFANYFKNSVIVLAISLILLLFISACASYPLARFKFKMAQPIYAIIVACMSIPVHITLIPVFKMSKSTGLYDTIWSLIGPYVAFAVPISVFILTSFMKEIPREIEESAEIDGCGKIQMFFSMILPLSKPGMATLAIYNGVNMWNEFSFVNTLTQSAQNRTLPLAIWEFQGQYSMNTPMIMAVLTLTLLPMVIMFIIFQDKLVKGMTASAYVKRKPIATEDISIGINQITLKIVSFLPPKSRNVAIASPNGIWIMIDTIMIITLFLNAIQNFVSLISFAQFASPTIFLSAEIPFHWYPLVINVSIIGYAINTTNKMITGARKSAAV